MVARTLYQVYMDSKAMKTGGDICQGSTLLLLRDWYWRSPSQSVGCDVWS